MGITLLIAAVLGLIPAAIASRKGRSFLGWWVYGTLLWIVALIHSIVLRPSDAAGPVAGRPLRACPSCRKEIDDRATFCRHCGAAIAPHEGHP
jgi:hypothetical protein